MGLRRFRAATTTGLFSGGLQHFLLQPCRQRIGPELDAARRQQPQNVDVLYNLACADQADQRSEAAVALLAQAARLAPERSDVQKLLALATGDLGAMDDSAAAWDRYLKLQPNDDV